MLSVTGTLESVALAEAVATTMPPTSGPVAWKTPTWPVIVLPVMPGPAPPVMEPPELCVA